MVSYFHFGKNIQFDDLRILFHVGVEKTHQLLYYMMMLFSDTSFDYSSVVHQVLCPDVFTGPICKNKLLGSVISLKRTASRNP